MINIRKYGKPPFSVAVIHGGPGAPGEMVPVARWLEGEMGILEPLQTAKSLEGQVAELSSVLKVHGDVPVTLIGFSWGAWLSFLCAAQNPEIVKKLILVGSGPFEDKYAAGILETRLNRLDDEDKAKVNYIIEILDDPAANNKDALFARFGELLSKADAYNPIVPDEEELEKLEVQVEIFENVWESASELRKSGELLELGKRVKCPVVAIHGDSDPHPAEGVRKPLSKILEDFRFILVEKCGHKPWIEREARDKFFEILKKELS